MKNINYKRLRNLPKFDIGTRPISSGYQLGLLSPVYVDRTKNADSITDSSVQQSIADTTGGIIGTVGLANSIKSNWTAPYTQTYTDMIFTPKSLGLKAAASKPLASGITNSINYGSKVSDGLTFNAALNAPGKIVMDEATINSLNEAAVESSVTGTTTKTTAGHLSKAAYPLIALQALSGLYDTAKNFADTDVMSSGDLMNSASRYTNSDGADLIGGVDAQGWNKYLKNVKTSSQLNFSNSFSKIGSAAGSFFGPVGTIAGDLAGRLLGFGVGSIFGHSKKEKAKRLFEDYIQGMSNWNMQSESEAASRRMRSDFHSATHADEGLSVDTKNPNALVQGGEPILKYKNGKLVAADMFPITPLTPERVDNIPVRLDKGNAKDGVIGNLRDPETGERLAVEARPWVEAYNSPDPELLALGEANLNQIMEKQELLLKMRKIRQYHMGKCLPMLDEGDGLWYSVIPAAIGSLASLKLYFDYNNSKASRPNTYARDAQSDRYLQAMANRRYDISNLKRDINDAARMSRYAINQSAMAPGAKLASYALTNSNMMRSLAAAYAEKNKMDNLYIGEYAQAGLTQADRDYSRMQQANQYDNNVYNDAKKVILGGKERAIASGLQTLFNLGENLNNYYYMTEYLKQNRLKLSNEQMKLLKRLNP